MLYLQHYIETIHFWLKYNGLAIVRKTTKLIEAGQRGVQDYRHIMLLLLRFLRFFFKQKTAYEMLRSLVGSEMCIRDSVGGDFSQTAAPVVIMFHVFVNFVGVKK